MVLQFQCFLSTMYLDQSYPSANLDSSSNLQIALYNNHAHYQHLYDLIAELKSYGSYQAGSDEPLSEDLQEKVDQTIVDYLNGTHLFMCFNPDPNTTSKVFPPEGSLCGLLSLSIKEVPIKEVKNTIDPTQSTLLTLTALKGAMQSASKGNFDLSEHFKAIAELNPQLNNSSQEQAPEPNSNILDDEAQLQANAHNQEPIEDQDNAHDQGLENSTELLEEDNKASSSSSIFDNISSDELKAKVAQAEATLAALNALNAQKAAQEQTLENEQEQSLDNEADCESDSNKLDSTSPSSDTAKSDPDLYCYINRVYVRPQDRHQGAASKLLLQAIDFAKEQDCKQIILSTIATYKSAINLYEKLGFEELDINALPENIKVRPRTLYMGIKLEANPS